jgi:hypothetical protein
MLIRDAKKKIRNLKRNLGDVDGKETKFFRFKVNLDENLVIEEKSLVGEKNVKIKMRNESLKQKSRNTRSICE